MCVCNPPVATLVCAVHGTCECLRKHLKFHIFSDNLAIRVTPTHYQVLDTEAVRSRGLDLPQLRWRLQRDSILWTSFRG